MVITPVALVTLGDVVVCSAVAISSRGSSGSHHFKSTYVLLSKFGFLCINICSLMLLQPVKQLRHCYHRSFLYLFVQLH
jgi:hypothetical protein